ncbi:hypothetical protein [Nitrospirillum pindoramense]|uniref:Uncharacterized protein n=1 Tax=Nitrospirillum amazonense TaxID=28077 RepID=A0A560H9Z3_9PROT|nr:hypothetical protein [Nitrospirillum amazonense]TWB42609.1 hypothetical protein FBZ90_106209 [Nitrospirillum amazonense]
MIELNQENIEFICHVMDELDAIDEAKSGFLKERTLRELAMRLRQVLQPHDSTLMRLFKIFGEKVRVSHLVSGAYLGVVQDLSSPATYAVEFLPEINSDLVSEFWERNKRSGCLPIGTPTPGLPEENFILDSDNPVSLDIFCKTPIAFVGDVIITRFQLVEWAANKKGNAHFDDRRKNSVEEAIDKLWSMNMFTGAGDGRKRIRIIYEMIQIIAKEILRSPALVSMRLRLHPIHEKFGR